NPPLTAIASDAHGRRKSDVPDTRRRPACVSPQDCAGAGLVTHSGVTRFSCPRPVRIVMRPCSRTPASLVTVSTGRHAAGSATRVWGNLLSHFREHTMTVTTSYSFTNTHAAATINGPGFGNLDLASLSNGGFAVSGFHYYNGYNHTDVE